MREQLLPACTLRWSQSSKKVSSLFPWTLDSPSGPAQAYVGYFLVSKFLCLSRCAFSIKSMPLQNPSPTHKKFRVINVACGKSSVSCGIQLEKSSYVPGDFLTVICDISNSSPWHIFPRASLIRLESYSGKDGCVKEVKDELVFTAGEAIKPYSDVRWSLPVWTIPHNAPVSLLDCALIKNCYFILVRERLPVGKSVRRPFLLPIHT